MDSSFTDEQMVAWIKQGGPQLSRAVDYLYKGSGFREMILHLIRQKKGSREDAEDIFQDGVRHLIMNIRQNKFRGDSALKSYLSKICLNLWHTRFNRSVRLQEIKQELPLSEELSPSPEEVILYREREQLLSDTLARLGDPCRKVLSLWALNYSMKEIAGQTPFKNEGVVRKKKHQCFQKLMKLLQERPDLVKELLAMREQ